ncbi:MAG: bifunctional 2-C-methyl-D-erythritol 4-phosphate cytidylyltransferase/2-C-methyl-D-erythritol 2,4-cyclodiphosphate synthase [Pseudomonadota bacterium]
MSTSAIIVAAGRGERAGRNTPKQLAPLGGRSMLDWSLAAFVAHPEISSVVLVVPQGEEDQYASEFPRASFVVAGGKTRALSVRAGLDALLSRAGEPVQRVLVHDAARPGVDAAVISSVIAALDDHDGAAPALAVVDALKRTSSETLLSVDRSDLWRVQTPQGFRIDILSKALDASDEGAVDDLAAAEAIGAKLGLVAGSERLAKVTYPEDFARMETLLGASPQVRMGTGFDVHAFEPGDHVTLCGVEIPHSAKLKGHSDADVAWHALTDAIFGALALGDIGDHFPPSEPEWAGAPSHIFLEKAVVMATECGLAVSNCDLTIICEAPKVKPHREAMRERTAEILGVPVTCVSVKATTTEGLGFTGRGEGIAAQAAVVLSACQT